MANESTKNVGFSMRALDTPARRDADLVREQKEREGFAKVDGRARLKRGRSENVNFKTTREIKKLLVDMADAEAISFTEVIEDALRLRDRHMRGSR